MQSVPAPHLLGARPGARRRVAWLAGLLALVAAVAGTVALAGTRAGSPSPPAARPAAMLIGGVPLQQARCVQWLAGSQTERSRTVSALAYVAGGPSGYGPGATLSQDAAFALFDRTCTSPIAANFLLYEIYNRAAAFRSQAP